MPKEAKLALGQQIEVLRLKMSGMEQQIASIQRDVRRILFLMEQEEGDPGDSAAVSGEMAPSV